MPTTLLYEAISRHPGYLSRESFSWLPHDERLPMSMKRKHQLLQKRFTAYALHCLVQDSPFTFAYTYIFFRFLLFWDGAFPIFGTDLNEWERMEEDGRINGIHVRIRSFNEIVDWMRGKKRRRWTALINQSRWNDDDDNNDWTCILDTDLKKNQDSCKWQRRNLITRNWKGEWLFKFPHPASQSHYVYWSAVCAIPCQRFHDEAQL